MTNLLKRNSKRLLPLEVVLLILFSIAFFYIRRSELIPINAIKNFNSDNAIFLMMAQDILEGNFPFFFYGQNYMGPFTSMVIALNQLILDIFEIKHPLYLFKGHYKVSPVAGVLACSELFYIGLLVSYFYIRKTLSRFSGFLTIGVAGLLSPLIYEASIRPLGSEQAFFFSAILLLLIQRVIESPSNKKLFLLGLVAGVSWWMNQIVIFILAPAFLYWLMRQPFYQNLRKNLSLKKRFFLKNIHEDKKTRFVLLFIHFILLINLIFGLIVFYTGKINTKLWGIKLKMTSAFGPLKSSIAIFIFIQLIIFFVKHKREALKNTYDIFQKSKHFLFGAVIGHSPVIIGKIFNLYPDFYTIKFQLVGLSNVTSYWRDLLLKYYPEVIFSSSLFNFKTLSSLVMLSVLILAIVFLIKNWEAIKRSILLRNYAPSHKYIIGMSLLLASFYLFFSLRAQSEFATRYFIFEFVIILIAIFSIKSSHKSISALKVFVISSLVYFNYHGMIASKETYQNEKNVFTDLKNLAESGYQLCYAGYWTSYKYEYLTNKRVKFIVYKEQDRTPHLTEIREKSPLDKCFFEREKKPIPFGK